MPRKKQKKGKKSLSLSKNLEKNPIKKARFAWSSKWTESYSSFLLGIVVVIVVVLFGVTLIRQQHKNIQDTSSLSIGPNPTAIVSPTPGSTLTENGKTYYVVKAGDSLWTIAESVYKDGYSWTKIAEANNLSNPSTIFAGDKLLLPDAPSVSKLGQLMQKDDSKMNSITTNTYIVQQGDTVWDIAVRAYADGYQWTKIADANNLSTPDLIFSGTILKIPRDK